MEGSSPRRALAELMRRGTENMRGADRLAAEANSKRRKLLQQQQPRRHAAGHQEAARRGGAGRTQGAGPRARRRRPVQRTAAGGAAAVARQGGAGALRVRLALATEARQKYEQIKDLMGREMLDQRFAGMKEALENATDEDRQRVNDMLDDLNELAGQARQGRGLAAGLPGLHGQARRVLPGESEEHRRASRLAGQAGGRRAAVPQQPVRRSACRAGCLGAAGIRLAVADECARQAGPASAERPARRGLGGLGAVQAATTRWAWGRARRRWPTSASSSNWPSSCRRATPAPRWTTSTSTCWPANSATRRPSTPARCPNSRRALMNQGFLDRGADGQWRLSPKAMRQLGQMILRDVAQQLSGRHGERDTRRAGAAGELTGATRPWQFGDTEPWNVTRTLTNAVLAEQGRAAAEHPPLASASAGRSRLVRPPWWPCRCRVHQPQRSSKSFADRNGTRRGVAGQLQRFGAVVRRLSPVGGHAEPPPEQVSRPRAWTCAGVPRGANHASRSQACQSSAPSSEASQRLTAAGCAAGQHGRAHVGRELLACPLDAGRDRPRQDGRRVGRQRGVDVTGLEQVAHQLGVRPQRCRQPVRAGTR